MAIDDDLRLIPAQKYITSQLNCQKEHTEYLIEDIIEQIYGIWKLEVKLAKYVADSGLTIL